ncbi:MAG: cob(I)yrinic acid a,c-diamide adenosyltransferase, partial [Acidobacteria bacterium]|nr:cob(I)yrinic acid a,c-diamide adenosyltransferase [Acidobacteriota bacterium]
CFLEEDKSDRPVPGIEPRHVEALEALLDRLTAEVGPLENFILPGGSTGSAHLHVARAVCRRAERLVVALAEKEAIGAETVRYLNRLSDALFVMARFENKRKSVEDVYWDSRS